VKREYFLLLLFAGIVLPLHADDDKSWSPVDHGLQARLFISQPQTADYTFAVSIEFRNVLENSAAIGVEQRLNFNRDQLVFSVVDAQGHIVRPSPAGDEGLIPGWSLTLPAWCRLSFPIGVGGGTPQGSQGNGKLLSFGGEQQWLLAPGGGPYQLSATFYSDFNQALQAQADANGGKVVVTPVLDRPAQRLTQSHGGWQGTLDLPPINLPQN
jgi:hypothetical protein